ncbi:gp53-like domain-containing protein [Photorhabdus sp. SF281]|uniref:gp53-like domain-containing protein n=1 Tax=Photorhabdus sp. SF281 TaxID=3459527 RepID=UPI00404451DC
MDKANNAVPNSRRINGKSLVGDISLNAGDVGAYPKSGGVVNGNVDATGYISGKGVYEAPGIRVYSSMNKPSPGELGAYTTIEVDSRVNTKGNKNIASKAVNGWWKCGDTGIIYQWGCNLQGGAGKATIEYPIPFPNACLSMQVSVHATASPADNYSTVYKFNSTSAVIGRDQLGSYWFAIGY